MSETKTPYVIGELVAERARTMGNKRFLRFKDQSFTYSDMDRLSNRCANGFQKLGVNKNDKVSIMLANSPEFIHIWFGCAKAGAVEVPINTSYKGEFLRHIIDQSDSKMLVIGEEFLDRVPLIQDDLKKLEKIIVLGDRNKVDGLKIPVIGFQEFFDNPETPVDVKVDPWDPHSIIYTSGTTGLSKGGLQPHKMYVVVAEKLMDRRDGRQDDIFYTFLPLYHFNAQDLTTITAMVAGAEMVLSDKFSASKFWGEIRQYGATQFNYLGAVIPILAKQPEKSDDLDNPVRIAFGAGCPQSVMDHVEKRFGMTCVEGFGMTEIGIPIHVSPSDRRPGSCGKALDIYEIKLVDDDDVEVPFGEPGEIIFRPKEPFTMMLGYYNMPDKTLECYRNLWFHSGDLAKKDADGYFYFVDRKKDSLRRRGENISSFEVERAINTHPAVLESAAVAVKSELAEDEVKICVVLKPGATLQYEELTRHAEERMPYFAVPRFVEFMDSLPKTPTERVQKYLLKQAGITPNTWDREKAGVEVRR
ncbi:MAG: Long-chain-fatty-acid--CoA ligase [Syntrophorhabdus sp. PtaU1.Bin153]|nr:MAG: Long-chain-fatty-acid--CoA ligase [Syntrophorhabdus sp. PtaU1.Bin153]